MKSVSTTPRRRRAEKVPLTWRPRRLLAELAKVCLRCPSTESPNGTAAKFVGTPLSTFFDLHTCEYSRNPVGAIVSGPTPTLKGDLAAAFALGAGAADWVVLSGAERSAA